MKNTRFWLKCAFLGMGLAFLIAGFGVYQARAQQTGSEPTIDELRGNPPSQRRGSPAFQLLALPPPDI